MYVYRRTIANTRVSKMYLKVSNGSNLLRTYYIVVDRNKINCENVIQFFLYILPNKCNLIYMSI